MKIIDTREDFEYQQSHVDDAINISPTEFMSGDFNKKLAGVDKDEEILLYCRSGQRSNTCMQILKSHGYTNLKNGINEGHVKASLGL